jgi:hypothetical protein
MRYFGKRLNCLLTFSIFLFFRELVDDGEKSLICWWMQMILWKAEGKVIFIWQLGKPREKINFWAFLMGFGI